MSRKCATDNCQKASKVYQSGKMKVTDSKGSVKSSQKKRSSSKTVRPTVKDGHITKQSSSASLAKPPHSSECVPAVKVVNHVAKSNKRPSKTLEEGTVKIPSFHSTSQSSSDSSLASCVEPHSDYKEEVEEAKFDLLRDG